MPDERIDRQRQKMRHQTGNAVVVFYGVNKGEKPGPILRNQHQPRMVCCAV